MDDPSPTSIKRWRIASNVFVQIALWLVILGAVNYLSCRRYVQWDRTVLERYSLTQHSEQVLGAMNQNVKITALFDRDNDIARYVSQLLDIYRSKSSGKVQVAHIDPRRDPTALADLRNRRSDLRFEEELLFVEPEKGDAKILRESELVDREDTTFSSRAGDKGRVTAYHVEPLLTQALVSIVRSERYIVYLITDKGGLRSVDQRGARGDAGGVLQRLGKQYQGMEVRPLALGSIREIPEDADAVMLIGPEQDLSGEEIKMLFREYWERRHGGLMILFDPENHGKIEQMRNQIAGYYGVMLEDDRVLTVVSEGGRGVKDYEVPVVFSPESSINRKLLNRSLRLARQTASLKLYNPNEDAILRSGNVRHTVLMLPAPQFWKERDYRQETVVADKKELLDVNVAVAVEKGGSQDERVRVNSSRMVLVGNSSLLDPDSFSEESLDFVFSSLSWLSRRDDLAGQKLAGSYKVDVLPSQLRKLDWYAVRILPAAVFLLGCVVMSFRRR